MNTNSPSYPVRCPAGKLADGGHVFNITKGWEDIPNTLYKVCACGISEPYYRSRK